MVLARWEGRGPRRSFGDDNEASAQTPPPPPCCAGWSPSPTCVGADACDRSRGATGARVACSRCQTAQLRVVARMSGAISGYDRRTFMPLPDFASLIRATKLSFRLTSGKERKEMERRQTHTVMPARIRRAGRATEKAACAALPLRARSPAGVPPRHLRQRPNATAQLQFTRFLGRNELGMGVTHPRPSQCSGRYEPAGRSSCRPGVLARSRPGAGVTAPPAGTALAPSAGVTRRRPFRARLAGM
jgi:hypothetical protein